MNGVGRWIPLWFFSAAHEESRTIHDINLGGIMSGRLQLRGYHVNFTVSNESTANIRICGPKVFDEQAAKGLFNWRFRWLQTVANDYMNDEDEDDIVYIYNISIITVANGTHVQLFQDDFSEGDKLRWVYVNTVTVECLRTIMACMHPLKLAS